MLFRSTRAAGWQPDHVCAVRVGGHLQALQAAALRARWVADEGSGNSDHREFQLLGLPACTGHELTGAYGLEMRTVSAAINASILPVVERTAAVVEEALVEAGLDVPLLVLRGDGGAMSLEAFRQTPSFSIGAGPAAGAPNKVSWLFMYCCHTSITRASSS